MAMGELDTRAALADAPVLTDWAARALDVIRWIALLVLVADVLLGLLSIPRDATLGELRRDLADGRVRSVSIVDPEMLRSTYVVTGHHPGSADTRSVVLWRVGTLGYRVADLPLDPSRTPSLRGLNPSTDDLPMRWSGAGTAVLVLLVLVVMLAPQPRRTTKWALFWLLLMPLNAGMIWALLREAPWSPAARALPVPAPHRFQPADRRRTGGVTFVWLLVACLVGQLVLHTLAQHTW
jgi:hypothetical protein